MGYRIKQVVVVRVDLGMSTGKIAAQVAHAAVLGVQQLAAVRSPLLAEWSAEGQPKVVLRVPDEAALAAVAGRAERAGLPLAVVADRGLTELAPGTVTCLAIGPAPAGEVDRVTGALPLL